MAKSPDRGKLQKLKKSAKLEKLHDHRHYKVLKHQEKYFFLRPSLLSTC